MSFFKNLLSGTQPPEYLPDLLEQQIKNGEAPLVLDVRTADEYSEAHIPGARNICIYDLPTAMSELASWKDKTVVVHCRSGVRAGNSAKLLTEAGFTGVRVLKGNMMGWLSENRPIKTGSHPA